MQNWMYAKKDLPAKKNKREISRYVPRHNYASYASIANPLYLPVLQKGRILPNRSLVPKPCLRLLLRLFLPAPTRVALSFFVPKQKINKLQSQTKQYEPNI